MNLNEPLSLLGGMSAQTFMREYWQKKPLLIRQAFPQFKAPVKFNDLKKLAKQDDVESRLVWQENDTWNLERGPFEHFPKLSEPNWTLLVQSMDLHHPKVADLIPHFRFVPDARLDDIMISYASKGGGVGPHFDSYDVFLLQGYGQRHWRISTQKDQTLIPDLPCRILKNFHIEQEWVLEPGDMLYLPPQCAHDGIAVSDECMTISIGFRTITHAHLARGMLEAAADQISSMAGMGYGTYSDPPISGNRMSGFYRDRTQKATDTPAQVPTLMIKKAVQLAHKVQFNDALAARFIGISMSEPNQLALFESSIDLDFYLPDQIHELSEKSELWLDTQSRILYYGDEIYLNGECTQSSDPLLKQFANEHCLSIQALKQADEQTLAFFQDALDRGYVHIRNKK